MVGMTQRSLPPTPSPRQGAGHQRSIPCTGGAGSGAGGTLAAMPVWTVPRRFAAAVAVVSLLFAWLGVGPTETWSFGAALMFWALSTAIGLGLAVAAAAALGRRSVWVARPRWIVIGAAGLIGLLAYVPLAMGLEWLLPGPPEPPDDWLDRLEQSGVLPAALAELLQAGPPYLLTWALINIAAPASLRPAAERAVLAPSMPMPPPPLHSAADALGWPPAIGDEVLAVTADLHYLQISTRLGRATVLGSLAAVEQHFDAAGVPGLRLHRSHWVALSAVRHVRRTGNGWVCELVDGQRLPVSRRRVAEVRQLLGQDFVLNPGLPAAQAHGATSPSTPAPPDAGSGYRAGRRSR